MVMKVSGLLKKSKSFLETTKLGNMRKKMILFSGSPYLPISDYSDFKDTQKEQFYEEDHVELAYYFTELKERGMSYHFDKLKSSFHS